jgi:Flp pilus assembly pilin Flp
VTCKRRVLYSLAVASVSQIEAGMDILKRLWTSEEGQELTEYVLLLAAIALCTAALVTGPMSSVNQIWVDGNTELNTAQSVAGS